LQEFCGVLVDYVSAGHFEIYEQLTGEAKAFNDKRGLELAETLYPRIDVITEKLLAFNDLCDAGKCVAEKFKELGGLLHERFELEDCLIEVLHTLTRQKIRFRPEFLFAILKTVRLAHRFSFPPFSQWRRAIRLEHQRCKRRDQVAGTIGAIGLRRWNHQAPFRADRHFCSALRQPLITLSRLNHCG
jgi:hypothetical protein